MERLQQCRDILGKHAQGKTCDAIKGIIAEEEEIMDEFSASSALGAGLISSAQAVEHYEIARYADFEFRELNFLPQTWAR